MNLRILLSNNHSDTLVLNMPLPQEVCVPLSPTLNPSHLWVFFKKNTFITFTGFTKTITLIASVVDQGFI